MAGNKAGRPQKTFEDVFTKGWQDKLIALYRKGYSDVQIRYAMNIPRYMWDKFLEENKEFSTTISVGKDYSQGWWQFVSQRNLKNKDFNNTLYITNMVNRFCWSRDLKDKN